MKGSLVLEKAKKAATKSGQSKSSASSSSTNNNNDHSSNNNSKLDLFSLLVDVADVKSKTGVKSAYQAIAASLPERPPPQKRSREKSKQRVDDLLKRRRQCTEAELLLRRKSSESEVSANYANNPAVEKALVKMIGVYNPEQRRIRLARWREKRQMLNFGFKGVKYPTRRVICMKRKRMNGKFTSILDPGVTSEELEAAGKPNSDASSSRHHHRERWPLGPSPYFFVPCFKRQRRPKMSPNPPSLQMAILSAEAHLGPGYFSKKCRQTGCEASPRDGNFGYCSVHRVNCHQPRCKCAVAKGSAYCKAHATEDSRKKDNEEWEKRKNGAAARGWSLDTMSAAASLREWDVSKKEGRNAEKKEKKKKKKKKSSAVKKKKKNNSSTAKKKKSSAAKKKPLRAFKTTEKEKGAISGMVGAAAAK